MADDNILCVKNIKKSFGGVHALKGVDLTIRRGEIHCLAGENGCGKSTIIKVISGFYQPDEGDIEVNGKHYDVMTPKDAIEAGIQVIYQDFSVFPNLTVMENLSISQIVARKEKFVSKKKMREVALECMKKVELDVELDALVETLSVADKQLIAIARALMADAKLLIMDESTTALTRNEVERLFDIVLKLKEQGVTILFISHKLEEVFEISDSITIMRSGENVISCPMKEMDEEKFTYYMTGRHFDAQSRKNVDPSKYGDIVLEAKDLRAPGFGNVSFSLHKGEILGVVGQLGSGRTELSLTLFGMNRPMKGQILFEGKEVQLKTPQEAIDLGIALVPEDRLTEGLFLIQSIKENITIADVDELINKAFLVDAKKRQEQADYWVKEMGVATSDSDNAVQTLSGGNQQKVVLGKWLARHPKVLILNGPTVGVDIGAKYDIHDLLKKLADDGMAVIIVSDDMSEVIATCDKAIVMKGGLMTGSLSSGDLTVEKLSAATV